MKLKASGAGKEHIRRAARGSVGRGGACGRPQRTGRQLPRRRWQRRPLKAPSIAGLQAQAGAPEKQSEYESVWRGTIL